MVVALSCTAWLALLHHSLCVLLAVVLWFLVHVAEAPSFGQVGAHFSSGGSRPHFAAHSNRCVGYDGNLLGQRAVI